MLCKTPVFSPPFMSFLGLQTVLVEPHVQCFWHTGGLGTGVQVPSVLVLPKLLVVAKRCHLRHGESLMFPFILGHFALFATTRLHLHSYPVVLHGCRASARGKGSPGKV